jgi:hypothetical protein
MYAYQHASSTNDLQSHCREEDDEEEGGGGEGVPIVLAR